MYVTIIVLEIQYVHISEGLHVMTKNGFISHDLENTDFLLHKYIETVELHLTFATAQSCTSETQFVALAPATTVCKEVFLPLLWKADRVSHPVKA